MRAGSRKGNVHLASIMVEAAWATARTKTRPGARLRRLIRRFGEDGKKKAAAAAAHTLLRIVWAVLTHDSDYHEDGADYYDRPVDPVRQTSRRLSALRRLGYDVTLVPITPVTPTRTTHRLTSHPSTPTNTLSGRGNKLCRG